jgi:hypothetical protein
LRVLLDRYRALDGAGAGELGAVLAMMEALRASGSLARAVYWLSC